MHNSSMIMQAMGRRQAPAQQHMFSNKSIPYLIEESIRICMDIEDVDSVLSSAAASASASSQHQSSDRPPIDGAELHRLHSRRQSLLDALADSLDMIENPADQSDTSHLIYTFIQHRQGRLLLFRSLLLMRGQQQYIHQVIAILLIDISVLIK